MAVCQVPGCSTTQAAIEVELETYLAGYCAQCAKPREGKLCGCAFPCSLTFKGQMLLRIHSLLGLEPQAGLKAMQVCYKHPELLRRAREASIALRDQVEDLRDQEEDLRDQQEDLRDQQEDEADGRAHKAPAAGLPDPVILGGLADKREGEEGVTSIVYTDEGGREQSLVGKIVYQTDESGQSNIIIQEVEPRQLHKKLMKFDLGDVSGYMALAGPGVEGQSVEEALEQRLEEELEGNEARLEEELDFEVATEAQAACSKETGGLGLKFQLEDAGQEPAGQASGRGVVPSLQGIIQTSGIASHLLPSGHQPAAPASARPDLGPGAEVAQGDNMLKIQYKEYDQKILGAELRPLLGRAELCDTVLVCRDGRMLASSLLLASLSAFLRQALHSVPRIDAFKTVILPEEISVSQIILLNKIIFDEQQTGGAGPGLDPEQQEQLAVLGSVLGYSGPAGGGPGHRRAVTF